VKRLINIIMVLAGIAFAVLAIYTAVVMVSAIRPQTARPTEIKNPEIIMDAAGQRYLHMEIYNGHSALSSDGAMLRVKDDTLFVRPVYCLIDPPVTLCYPDVNTEYVEQPAARQFSAIRIALPENPDRVLLTFRYGDPLEVK